MCDSCRDNNIFDEITDADLKKLIPVMDEDDSDDDVDYYTFINKELIQRVWLSCIKHGYVNECLDTLGCFMDKMAIEK